MGRDIMPNMFENVDNNFAHVVCRRLKILVHFSLKLGNFTFSRNKVWKYPDLNLYLFRVFSRSVWSRFWHISDKRRSLCTMDPRIFVLVIKFYRNIEHLHFGISILNYLFFCFDSFSSVASFFRSVETGTKTNPRRRSSRLKLSVVTNLGTE